MSADVGHNIPERGPTDRIKEGLYPGDFTDVAAFNDRLYCDREVSAISWSCSIRRSRRS